jgi:hypothetical protein
MDSVDARATVGSVLNASAAQGSSVSMLGYVQGIRGFTQDTVLETMVSNELLSTMSGFLKSIDDSLKSATREFIKALSGRGSSGAAFRPGPQAALAYKPTGIPGGSQEKYIEPAFRRLTDDSQVEETNSQLESVADYSEAIKDATQSSAASLRNIAGGVGVEKPKKSEPVERPKKKDEELGGHEGIGDWLLELTGIGEELAILGTFKDRLTGTAKNAQGLFNKVTGWFGGGKAAAGASKAGKSIAGKAAGAAEKAGAEGIGEAAGGLGKAAGLAEGVGAKGIGEAATIAGEGASIAGKAASFGKAIPVIGEVILAVLAIKDAANALGDSKRISGKAKEFQTLGDKIEVGISGIISGVTLGLVDSRTIFKVLDVATKGISHAFDAVFAMLPTPLRGALSTIYDFLFDKKTGIFGAVYTRFESILDEISSGKWAGALLDAVILIPESIIGPIVRLGKKIAPALEAVWPAVKQTMTDAITTLFEWIKNAVTHPWDTLLKFTSSIDKVVGAVVDGAPGLVDKAGKRLASATISSVDALGDVLTSGGSALLAHVESADAGSREARASDLSQSTGRSAQHSVARANVVSQAPQVVNTQPAMQASKSRMDAANQTPQVNVSPVINVPAPESTSESIIRRTEGSDRGLAFANYM